VRIEETSNPAASEFPAVGAVCPTDAILLGGGCAVNDSNDEDLTLYQAGGDNPTNYYCAWRNQLELTIDEVKAWAICLVPADGR
jgi:hypothetical protein